MKMSRMLCSGFGVVGSSWFKSEHDVVVDLFLVFEVANTASIAESLQGTIHRSIKELGIHININYVNVVHSLFVASDEKAQ